MMNIKATLFLLVISIATLRAQYNNPTVRIEDPNPISASAQIYESEIRPYCIDRTSGNTVIFPTGQSVENFISLVERLELMIANDSDTSLRQHIGPDNVAKLLLRRFRYDGYDSALGLPPQRSRDNLLAEVSGRILTPSSAQALPTDYTFPNKFFSQAELCSLYNILSHNIYDTTYHVRVAYSQGFRARAKRQSYNQRNNQNRQNQNQNQYNRQNQNQNQYNNRVQWADTGATSSPWLPVNNRATNSPIKEEGVSSFRSNSLEAIQLSRVLIGVIAGLSTDAKTRARDVLTALNPTLTIRSEYDKDIEPVMMVTLADLYGVTTRLGTSNNDRKYYYGLSGNWGDQCCTTYYGISTSQISQTNFNTSANHIEATKAEIRGGIDGYKIGKALQNMGTTDLNRLKLSSILRSYYSKPQSQGSIASFTVGYCDRQTGIQQQDIENYGTLYAAIVAQYKGGTLPPNMIQDFKTAFTSAQSIETAGYNDYCTKPSGQLDANAPCETPQDVLYFIDGTTAQKLQDSETVVSQVNGNLQGFSLNGGTVSIFFNSNQKSNPNPDVSNQLPTGTGQDQWPFAVAAFNSSNVGYAQCRINDFNTTLPQAVANTGKYFRYLNATLFDYEYWNPRTNQSWVPGKTAVLIDYDSVTAAPNDGQDRDDYNRFKDQLRYRHRDVLYVSVARNTELFKDILRNRDTDSFSPTDVASSGSTVAKRICDNPATFQYFACNDRASSNIQTTGYISPGYKQNWAMYPEFFLKSFNIKFTFKAEDGNIRVCFDRTFPPQRVDWCFETNDKPQIEYEISNPCKGRSFESCDPFYFTIWGKDRTNPSQCLDAQCQNLNQIRWTVTHSGVQCNAAHHVLPSTAFQAISLTLFAILYLFLSK